MFRRFASLNQFPRQINSEISQIWLEHDQAQVGTPYWDYITDKEQCYEQQLVKLFNRHPIDYPGKEFLIQPDGAVTLLAELDVLGIAVSAVSVWCYVPANTEAKNCCPDGRGGPSLQTPEGKVWFPEYCHLGYSVPDFEQMPRTTNLAEKCNPLVRHYLVHQLPQEPGFSEHFRVSLDLYVPLQWELFP